MGGFALSLKTRCSPESARPPCLHRSMLWRLNDGALHVALGPLAYRRGFGRSDLCLACNEVDVSFWGPKQTLRGHPEMSALKADMADFMSSRPS